MRILVLIVMVIAFLIGGGASSMISTNLKARTKNINYEELATMKKLVAQYKADGMDFEKSEDPSIKNALETLEKTPAKWRVSTSGILGVILAIVALLMVVVAFMKKESVNTLSIVVPALALLLLILTPSIESGRTSGASPKSIAVIIFISLVIASASAFYSFKLYTNKIQK